MKQKKLKRFAVAALCCVLSLPLCAADVTLNSTGNYFASGDGWSDGKAPNHDNDYYVTGGKELRANGNGTFEGASLTLGNGSTAGTLMQMWSDRTLTVADLRLDTGYLINNGGGTAGFAGVCTVLSEGRAYGDNQSLSSIRHVNLSARIVGASSAVFKFYSILNGPTANTTVDPLEFRSEVHVTGDCSAYQGIYHACMPTTDPRNFKYYQAGVDLYLESATVLAAVSGSMQYDKLTIENHTKLFLSPAAAAGASSNAGMTVGGTNWISSTSSDSINVSMPITGDGTLVKVGAATMRLGGAITLSGGIVVEAGTLELLSTAAPAQGTPIVVKSGASLVCGVDPSLLDLTVEDGADVGFVVPYDTSTQTATPLQFDSETASLIPSWPMGVSLSEDITIPFTTTVRTCVVKMPYSVRELVPGDFTDLSGKSYGLPNTWFEIERDATDATIQDVYLVARPVVADATAADVNSFSSQTDKNSAAAWTDGLAPHPGADYLFRNHHELFTSSGSSGTARFAGDSLTLAGECVCVNIKDRYVDVDTLVAYSGMQYYSMGYATTADQSASMYHVLRGLVDLRATADNPFILRIKPWTTNSHTPGSWRIEGLFTGDGYVIFRSEDSRPECDAYIDSTNGTFTGGIEVGGTSASLGTTLKIRNPLSLGGARESFDYRSLWLKTTGSFLSPLETMTLDAANRGIYVQAGGFDVPEDVVLTVAETVRLAGTLVKKGAGTLRIAGGISFGASGSASPSDGTDNLLRVEEGYVSATGSGTSANLRVTFADGAGIEVNPSATGEAAAYGLRLPLGVTAEGALALTLAPGSTVEDGAKIPILTVPTPPDGTLLSKLEASAESPALKIRGLRAGIEADNPGEGVTRYSLRYRIPGLALFIR